MPHTVPQFMDVLEPQRRFLDKFHVFNNSARHDRFNRGNPNEWRSYGSFLTRLTYSSMQWCAESGSSVNGCSGTSATILGSGSMQSSTTVCDMTDSIAASQMNGDRVDPS